MEAMVTAARSAVAETGVRVIIERSPEQMILDGLPEEGLL